MLCVSLSKPFKYTLYGEHAMTECEDQAHNI